MYDNEVFGCLFFILLFVKLGIIGFVIWVIIQFMQYFGVV